jgi:penicillin-binding protein 1C
MIRKKGAYPVALLRHVYNILWGVRSLIQSISLPYERYLAALRGAFLRALFRDETLPVAAAGALLVLGFFLALPPERFPGDYSAAVYARGGELLGASVSRSGQWRLPPGAKSGAGSYATSKRFEAALVAYEDKHFYSHAGFDPGALVRAALQNERAGRIVSGGSTISMQVARLGRAGRERELGEKAIETLMAVRLELIHGKKGLLRLYAENAPFGGNVVGIEAASFRFFGRRPESLSWAEAATLAVLPNAPSVAHPGKNRELLQAKRDRLLRELLRERRISEADLELALVEPLPSEPYDLPSLAPQLVARFSTQITGGGGGELSRVVTTIDAPLQERASEALKRRSAALAEGGVYNGACIVARVDTGEVLAYVANVAPPVRDESSREYAGDDSGRGYAVDCIRAERSSGSLFKPFLYAAALEAGELGPRSLLPDLPTRYGSYEPENNLGTYSGAVRADEALARSLNVPFVRLLQSFGVERFHDILVSTGMTTLHRRAEDYGLTLILGGAETSLWEMAGRFAALARSAEMGSGPGASQVFDLGLTRSELSSRVKRPDPFSAGSAILTLDALTKVARPEEEAAWEDYASSRRIAWKTGTSFGYRDAWAIGVDGTFVAGVWFGNASGEGRPSLKGSAAAAPLLFDLFGILASGIGSGPAGRGIASGKFREGVLREIEVCADSGWAAGPDCERTETVLVPAGAKALPLCPYCVSVALSSDGRYRVRAEDEAPGSVRIEKRFVLPPAIERFYGNNLDYKRLPPWKPGSAQGASDRSLAIIAPEEGASIFIPTEITGRPGATVFSAAHRDADSVVFWTLDGVYLGQTRGKHSIEARPAAGEHVLTVTDASGRSQARRFTVLSKN